MEIDRYFGDIDPSPVTIVRFYTWERATISYGLNQNPVKRIYLEKCLRDGIELAARPTGGREILHGWDLCCSVIQPINKGQSGIEFRSKFDFINRVYEKGLNSLGIKTENHSITGGSGITEGSCFSQVDRGEITTSGKKIVASAQRVFDRTLLQQSSIPIEKPGLDLMSYLQISGKNTNGVGIVNSVAYLRDYMQETFSMSEIVDVFREMFESEMGEAGILDLPDLIKKD
jgi:lipoate-protein ligase A